MAPPAGYSINRKKGSQMTQHPCHGMTRAETQAFEAIRDQPETTLFQEDVGPPPRAGRHHERKEAGRVSRRPAARSSG